MKTVVVAGCALALTFGSPTNLAPEISQRQKGAALTREGPATVYITGFGPTDTHYVDAAADPRPR